MDPLTHTLAGAALAATVMLRRNGATRARNEWGALVCGALAGNAPDIDHFHVSGSGEPAGLSYLLYHRGHSHTLVGCAVLAFAIAGACRLLLPRKWRPGFWPLLAIAGGGALLHVVMDATNDYGVHPFWPVYDGWFYGDAVFLVEPLLIGALLPLALHPLLRDWGSRAANLRLVLGVALGLLLLIGFLWWRVHERLWMTASAAALASAWIVGLWIVRCATRSALVSWAAVLLVCAVFFGLSRSTKARARSVLAELAPGERLVQLATTPAAANPFCWRVVAASFDEATGQIRARMAVVSLLPAFTDAGDCFRASERGAAPASFTLSPIAAVGGEGWHWVGQFAAPCAELTQLAAADPRVGAARHFLRAPFWVEAKGAQPGQAKQYILGDLRMDYAEELSRYAKYRFPEPARGGFYEPPWQAPFFGPAHDLCAITAREGD